MRHNPDVKSGGTGTFTVQAGEFIDDFKKAVGDLYVFLRGRTSGDSPEDVLELQEDEDRIGFIEIFKEVRRAEIRFRQRTDVTPEEMRIAGALIPETTMLEFRCLYLDMVSDFEARRKDDPSGISPIVRETDFELALFSSALFDRSTVMERIARRLAASSGDWESNGEALVLSIRADSNFMKERDSLTDFILQLAPAPKSVESLEAEYKAFKEETNRDELFSLSERYTVSENALREIFENAVACGSLDLCAVRDLFFDHGLGWKERNRLEENLEKDLAPLVEKARSLVPREMMIR